MVDYTKIRTICDACGIAKGRQSDEYLFTLNAVDLFYYKRNIGQVDVKSSFTDGPNDGGIDYIYSDGETMYLIQGKSSDALSSDDIESVFTKIVKTVGKFEDKDTDSFSLILKSAYQNAYDDLSDEKNIELVLFTNTEIDENGRKRIAEFAKSNEVNSYKISVYDANDIRVQSAIINTYSELIPEGKIKILLSGTGKNDMLSYGEDGIIVNVMASSIKNLYEKHGKTGLFSYNLREYISQKTVDDGIETTIKQERDNFWFYNNGITIGCRDFEKDGNSIKLYDFSIINGAQTSTKIGKSKLVNDKDDFALVCKIVRSNKKADIDEDFIGKISEASNSQKPVKQRDLKANAKEQKILQNESATNIKYPLAIEIKRGVRPINYKKVDKWQRVTNEFVGQLIYACILQHPGLARNSKNTMFSSSKLYKQIFMRKHDSNTLYDLVRMASIYDEFAEEFIASSDDADQIALIKNGKLSVLAVVIYLYKKQAGIIDNYMSDKLNKDNINGLLITDYVGDDLDKKLKDLFKHIARELRMIYNTEKDLLKVTSYSNFFKSDANYEIICKHFDEIDDYDKEKINNYMMVFNRDYKK
ncbi:MAG: AIPR family protein [Pseudobutyrivibrio sp.]|nr:AIPR family protein [Pseudobutyrivibrio sp.]